MTNVATLRPAQPKAVPEVVEEIERLLEEAKRGDLRSIAYAGVTLGGKTTTGWSRDPQGSDAHVMGSAIGILDFRYFASFEPNRDHG